MNETVNANRSDKHGRKSRGRKALVFVGSLSVRVLERLLERGVFEVLLLVVASTLSCSPPAESRKQPSSPVAVLVLEATR